MKYTFGTTEKAAERLSEIAKFFNPPATDFIRRYIDRKIETAIDLGCGPGFTTDMLAQAIESNNVSGLDLSDGFLSMATARFPQYNFIKHDITKTPFPVTGNIAYARFLLSHLVNPVDLINRWTNELTNGGLLFVEELEGIETSVNVFKKYLAINQGLVATQGAELFVGGRLANGNYHLKPVCNESIKLPVPNWQAATWFYPNTVTIWQNEPYVTDNLTEPERTGIAQELLEIKDLAENKSEITWIMRRIVLKKE
jgi:trans-aconitate 2-methyltransferase